MYSHIFKYGNGNNQYAKPNPTKEKTSGGKRRAVSDKMQNLLTNPEPKMPGEAKAYYPGGYEDQLVDHTKVHNALKKMGYQYGSTKGVPGKPYLKSVSFHHATKPSITLKYHTKEMANTKGGKLHIEDGDPDSAPQLKGLLTPNPPKVNPKKSSDALLSDADGDLDSGSKANAFKAYHKTQQAKLVTTAAAESAITAYTGSSYQDMNSALRGKNGMTMDSISPAKKQHIKELTAVLNKSTIGMDGYLYRGYGGNTSEKLRDKINAGSIVGHDVEDLGFGSTTTSKSFAKGWASGGLEGVPIVGKIRVKPNDKGMWVDNVSANKGEAEVILPPNTNMKITKSTLKNGVYYLDMEPNYA